MNGKESCKNTCELCGKKYKTYAIILCCDPLCIASFYEDEQKPDGSFRKICEECRGKEDKERLAKNAKEQLEVAIERRRRVSKEI